MTKSKKYLESWSPQASKAKRASLFQEKVQSQQQKGGNEEKQNPQKFILKERLLENIFTQQDLYGTTSYVSDMYDIQHKITRTHRSMASKRFIYLVKQRDCWRIFLKFWIFIFIIDEIPNTYEFLPLIGAGQKNNCHT